MAASAAIASKLAQRVECLKSFHFAQVFKTRKMRQIWPRSSAIRNGRSWKFPCESELIIRKGFRSEIDFYSASFENDRRTQTGFAGYLRDRGLRRIFMAGLATDFCVHYSAVDARRLGFDTVLVEAGCRAIDLAGSLDTA